jgi:hypothetical protein
MASSETFLARFSAVKSKAEGEAYLAELRAHLGPLVTAGAAKTKKQKSDQALKSLLQLLKELFDACSDRLAKLPGSLSPPDSNSQDVARFVVEVASDVLGAFEQLKAATSLEWNWSYVLSLCVDNGLFREGLAIAAKIRGMLGAMTAPSASGELVEKVRMTTLFAMSEACCLLETEGPTAKVLAMLDREWVPWVKAYLRLEEARAVKYLRRTSRTVQRVVAQSLAKREALALAGLSVRFILLAARKSPADFYKEAAACTLAVSKDPEIVAIAHELIAREA